MTACRMIRISGSWAGALAFHQMLVILFNSSPSSMILERYSPIIGIICPRAPFIPACPDMVSCLH